MFYYTVSNSRRLGALLGSRSSGEDKRGGVNLQDQGWNSARAREQVELGYPPFPSSSLSSC